MTNETSGKNEFINQESSPSETRIIPALSEGGNPTAIPSAPFDPAEVTPREGYPDMSRLVEEEGLLVEKEGRLELESEVKNKIIQAFKEETPTEETPQHEPRIFGKSADYSEAVDDDLMENEAVRILDQERQARTNRHISLNDEPSKAMEFRQEVVELLEQETPALSAAEVLMVKGIDYAVALDYSPGRIPMVIDKGRKKDALELINEAFRLDIPVIETLEWDTRRFRDLVIGAEIPEHTYSVAARALALIYRIKPDAYLVRFVKPQRSRRRKKRKSKKKLQEQYAGSIGVIPLTVELSPGLFNFSEELQPEIDKAARRLVQETGLVLPPVQIVENEVLKSAEYLLKLKGVTYDTGELDVELTSPEIFYPLLNRFRALINNFGYELMGYAEAEAVVHAAKKLNSSLVKAIFPSQLTIGAFRYILRGLLREQVPIRDVLTILEIIEGNLNTTSDPDLLIEYIRSAFSQSICNAYKDNEGTINAILMSKESEQSILKSIKETYNVRWLDMGYNEGLRFLSMLSNEVRNINSLGIPVVILTTPTLRRFIRKITESTFPSLPVLAYSEISPLTPVQTVGIIDMKYTGGNNP